MDNTPNGIVSAINSIFGGATTSLFGAAVGRLMWHAGEARAKRRKFVGRELFWEIPVVIGMWMIGLGLGDYFALSLHGTAALCSVLSYLGPRGTEVVITNWIEGKRKE